MARLRVTTCVFNLLFSIISTRALGFNIPLASQFSPESSSATHISSATLLSDAIGVSVPTRWSFSIGLQWDTCAGERVAYSSAGQPTWLTFNPRDVTFYGTSPSVAMDIMVDLECKVDGETAVEQFLIRVGRTLTLERALPTLLVSPRNEVSYNLIMYLKSLMLDGKALNADAKQTLSVAVNLADIPWLKYEADTMRFRGTPPDTLISLNTPQITMVPITFTLSKAHPLMTSLNVTLMPYLFVKDTFPDLQYDGSFSFTLHPFLRDIRVHLELELEPMESWNWISFDASSLALSGTPPKTHLEDLTTTVQMKVTSNATSLTATALMKIHPESSTYPTPFTDQATSPFSLSRVTIIVVVASVLGTLSLFAFTYTLLWLFRQQPNQGEEAEGKKQARRLSKRNSGGSQDMIPMPSPATSDTPNDHQHESRTTSFWKSLMFKKQRPSNLDLTPSLPARTRSQTHPKDARSPIRSLAQARFSPLSGPFPSVRSRGHSIASITGSVSPQLCAPRMERAPARSGADLPKPPPGLSPEQMKEWVDQAVCDWLETYESATSHRQSRGTSYNSQKSSSRECASSPTPVVVVEGMPHQHDQAPTPFAAFDRSFRPLSPPASRTPPNSALAAFSSFHMLPPRAFFPRSASRMTSTTFTTSDVHVPSDISSVASWDSLDSWEMERRYHYEEPRRRPDFSVPAKIAGSQLPKTMTTGDQPSVLDVVPSIVVTRDGGGSRVSLNKGKGVDRSMVEPISRSHTPKVDIANSPPMGGTLQLSHGSVGRVGMEGESVPIYTDFFEEEIVFFPRPAGVDVGDGLARSPHLDALSKFSGS